MVNKVHCWTLCIRDCNNPHKLSSQSCFCSADTIKKSEKTGWPQVLLPKQQICLQTTANCQQPQPNFCPSALMDRASSWTGLSKAPAHQFVGPSCRHVLLLVPVPTASPVQRSSHMWRSRGSPWSCLLHTLNSSELTLDHQTMAFYF